ncbi:MAG: amino acid permease [Kiritimatiellae bacterium]|nr:amino acid permease [Kiritimatiellia bacterium]
MENPVRGEPALHRDLGVLDIFCIAAGAMISSGLFVLPGLIYMSAGPAAALVYLLAGVLVIPALLCKAELGTAMPKAGGDYFFIERSLGAVLVSIAALLAYVTTANAGILSASRVPLAMSRDQLLPEHLSRIHPKRGTPVPAVWLTAVFMILSITFLDLPMLVKVASTMKIILFLLVCLAVILMRESRIGGSAQLPPARADVHRPDHPGRRFRGALAARPGGRRAPERDSPVQADPPSR